MDDRYTCIFGVIASESEYYNEMKKIWMDNVCIFNKKNKNKRVIVYFLYGNREKSEGNYYKIKKSNDDIYDLYGNCEESCETMIKKSIMFFEEVVRIYPEVQADGMTYIIRSNLSTLFNFEKHYDELNKINKDIIEYKREFKREPYFFGGTFVDSFDISNILFSGTNLMFNILSLKLIIKDRDSLIEVKLNDDVVISTFLVGNFASRLLLRDIKRLDIVEGMTRYKSCEIYDNSISCFRFKTSDRNRDVQIMKKLLDKMYLKDFKNEIFVNQIILENENVSNFLIIQDEENSDTYADKCFYIYADKCDSNEIKGKKQDLKKKLIIIIFIGLIILYLYYYLKQNN